MIPSMIYPRGMEDVCERVCGWRNTRTPAPNYTEHEHEDGRQAGRQGRRQITECIINQSQSHSHSHSQQSHSHRHSIATAEHCLLMKMENMKMWKKPHFRNGQSGDS
jgi:hypothetical protein